MHLNHFLIFLVDHGIATSDNKKVMVAGAQMWDNEMFTEDQMLAWENKPTAYQTWENRQAYFIEKWLEQKQ